ncbi:MAG TPA: tyrosine--tRNA ligase [Candidatus Hydrogenedentes bacterium]|nr:tyrosine--tRNA ligase [Candidatus Hydrogenedentota bacterium]
MSVIEELKWRGLLSQMTDDELPKVLDAGPMTLYAGFDPTADSLHIGSMIPIMGLVHFQRAGHRPIAVLGGATGLIGDPSFKATERQLLTRELVDENVVGIRKQLEKFIDFDGENAAEMVNNIDWMEKWSYIDFLRDVGKHFSVNVMMARDSVKQRLTDRDQGMSYTEFSYSLLQSYDFLHLYDEYNCQLQIGGSDQWGNIVAGMDLTRRMREDAKTYGLTLPLVTKADGAKFGKSESGNVWLDAERTSPYKFYQFWINQADADVVRYLKFFTLLSQDEIGALEQQVADEPHLRQAQKTLAEEVTRLVHGEEALQNAVGASEAMFGGDLSGLDEATLMDVFSEVPSEEIDRGTLTSGGSLLDLLVERGIFQSKGEGRRMIKNGGLYLNSARVEKDDVVFSAESLLTENMAIVRKGKKNYYLLKIK